MFAFPITPEHITTAAAHGEPACSAMWRKTTHDKKAEPQFKQASIGSFLHLYYELRLSRRPLVPAFRFANATTKIPDWEGLAMLSKCANPVCFAQFRYLHDGRVFRVELDVIHSLKAHPAESNRLRNLNLLIASTPSTPSGRPEYFWLCSTCAERLTLGIDHRGVVLVPALAARAAAA